MVIFVMNYTQSASGLVALYPYEVLAAGCCFDEPIWEATL